MIGEITAIAAGEVAKKTAVDTAKEIGKQAIGKAVDITKRVDVTINPTESKMPRIDITKRIQPEIIKDLKETAKDYMADLKAKSEFPDTINDTLDISKLEKITPEKNAKMREEFAEKKSDLRSEWERINGKEWPRYTEPVLNERGDVIRDVGHCYDAHHIHPLELGGKNEASNITPLDLNKHKEIHSKTGSCTKLVEKVVGGL